jgi:predicted Holliday junction resolvase-like endonuclease
MEKEIIDFYSSLRKIFGVCTDCEDIFRLSDCKLYQKSKPDSDWKEKLDSEIIRLENLEEKLLEKIELAKVSARESGRKEADKLIKKIDTIFSPNKLNPNDAKVVFHPVDFLVFNGMNSNSGDASIKNLVLLDKKGKTGENASIQNSIQKVVETQQYEWLTLRVEESGKIIEE